MRWVRSRRSSRVATGRKQRGQGQALRRLGPPWESR